MKSILVLLLASFQFRPAWAAKEIDCTSGTTTVKFEYDAFNLLSLRVVEASDSKAGNKIEIPLRNDKIKLTQNTVQLTAEGGFLGYNPNGPKAILTFNSNSVISKQFKKIHGKMVKTDENGKPVESQLDCQKVDADIALSHDEEIED